MKKVTMLLVGMMTMLTTHAQQQLGTALQPTDGERQAELLVERIETRHPGVLKAKGLTQEQMEQAQLLAAQSRQAPRKKATHYTGPGANQEFWFNMPQGTRLGYEVGMYHVTGQDGTVRLLSKDSSNNMIALFNGAVVDGQFHCITGDLSWSDYGLIICRDFIYDLNNNWQLYKAEEIPEHPYLISQEVAVDPKTHRVYGTFLRDDLVHYDIAWVNYTTKEIHRIGPARRDYPGLGMNAEGRLFGVDLYGDLYEISLVDGSDTKIGSTGLSVVDPEDGRYYYQSAECGVTDNVLYWAPTFPDGTSGLYAVDLATAKATKIHDFPNFTLIHCLTVPDGAGLDGAPSSITGLRALFDKTETTGELQFTLPATTFDGQALTGEVNYEIRLDGQELKNGTAQAGTDIVEQLQLAEGLHLAEVYASNEAGHSPQAALRFHVGLDQTGKVAEPQLAVHGTSAELSWQPATGLWGGYIGENVSYTITRYPDKKRVGTTTETSFTDQLPDNADYQRYSYGIIASNGTSQGGEVRTREVAAGQAYVTPYYDGFTSIESFRNNYTVIDANGDGITWDSNVNQQQDLVYYSAIQGSFSNIPPDDWLITPGIQLQAGRTYVLNFRAGVAGDSPTWRVNRVEITIGQGAAVSDQKGVIMPVTEYTENVYKVYSPEFTVATDGVYNIAFHNVSERFKLDFIIDYLEVIEKPTSASPVAVSNLTVTPGEKGAMQATVSFNAPSKTQGGAALTALTKVRVMRENRVLHTFDNPAPGQELSFTESPLPTVKTGFNTYSVVATNDVSDGPSASAKAYIGYDIPDLDYTKVSATDGVDHIRLAWTPVSTKGLNGGYVDPTRVSYLIYNVEYDSANGAMSQGDYLGKVMNSDHYDVPLNTEDGAQQVRSYAIGAANNIGTNEQGIAVTLGLVTGQSYTLPYIESASNSKLGNRLFWAETGNNFDATYKFTTDSYDNDNGSFVWSPSKRDYQLILNTGKISLAGATNPKLTFAHKADPKTRYLLDVAIETPDRQQRLVKSISYQNVSGDDAEWTQENIDLSSFMGEDYLIVKFVFSTNATSDRALKDHSIQLDAISVVDMQPYNLSVDLDTPANVVKGRTGHIDVVVHNVGENPARNYKVKLFVNDELFHEQTVADELPSLGRHVVGIDYKPTVFSRENRLTLRGEVEWSYDFVDDDNFMESELTISDPTVAQPRQALYVATANGNDLNWQAPERRAEEVEESFEDDKFTPFDMAGITPQVHEGMLADWTVWNNDLDGQLPDDRTGIVTGKLSMSGSLFDAAIWPNKDEICAWFVFDNSQVIGSMPVEPLTGKRMLATFNDWNDQDTWIITPELSGEEQVISFNAAAPIEMVGFPELGIEMHADATEVMEILYSMGGLTPDDFISKGTYTFDEPGWKDFTVRMPEGSKYLALRDISGSWSSLALFLDDFAYVRLSPLPVSYNIYGNEQLLQNVTSGDSFHVDGKASQYAITALYADGSESLPVIFTDAAGIADMQDDVRPADVRIFDLQGRRVLRPTGKGVYVVNGKTMILK